MGIFDKAKDLAAKHADKVEQGIEKAGDLIDQKTGNKHAAHVDKGQQFAKDQLLGDRSAPPAEQPPAQQPPAQP